MAGRLQSGVRDGRGRVMIILGQPIEGAEVRSSKVPYISEKRSYECLSLTRGVDSTVIDGEGQYCSSRWGRGTAEVCDRCQWRESVGHLLQVTDGGQVSCSILIDDGLSVVF